jgi:hypothetical protein
MPRMQPQKMPSTARLAFWRAPTLKPHMEGKNWLYMMMHRTAPWAANKKSLKRTVVSGDSGCLNAYCERIVDE